MRLLGLHVTVRDMKSRLMVVALVAATGVVLAATTSASSRRIPLAYKNCTALNQRYPHGLGRATAHDKTSGTPVTTFFRSNRLYRLAISYNARLDRDKDGIACEKT
jgi:Excalibur calcium-binding domain